MKVFNRDGEPVELGDNEILPDGFTLRVPAYLVDGVPQPTMIVDSAGRKAGHRPGFCYDASHDESAARIAHDAMVARASNAWRGPSAATATAVADAQTPEASRAAMIARNANAWRTPVKDQLPSFAELAMPDDDVEAARAAYKDRLQNAWRSSGGVSLPGPYDG